MKFTFRWYGPDDPVTLDNIRQIPCIEGVVTAVYDTPVGEVWSEESIAALKAQANDKGLSFEVIESVPVHEDIKLGRPTRDRLIDNYCENIRRLAKYGIKCICYNFMPVFDWTRTTMENILPDGSNALAYFKKDLTGIDPLKGELNLPGWDSSYKKEELAELFAAYKDVDEEKLFDNLAYFLHRVIPVAAECDVLMAIHPDDPPYPIFGLPRIITDEAHVDRFLAIEDSKYNGITFCTGSWGSTNANDIYAMLDKYTAADRVHFMHVRNIKLHDDDSFEECAHGDPDGSIDVVRVMKILKKNGFDRYLRPDHGRRIWGEKGRYGYGLYDRALGVSYISGIWEVLKDE